MGDPEQLQAIEAGAAFRSMSARRGGVEIAEVRRQHEEWQRLATRQLATGRTAQAIAAYDEAGHVHAAPTREEARAALIRGWDADRLSHGVSATMILTHTNQECDELNGLARDAMRRSGSLGIEYTVQTNRGTRLFAPGDRIMFLKNDRDLDVKNGTLATIEQVNTRHIRARLDDGRRTRFDTKDYADLTHGYAATIHKTQGVTVERTHVLATPGLDRHAAYVAMSRHRIEVQLHYGRDDFDSRDHLVRALSRERSKDMASDYARDFAERRQIRLDAANQTPPSKPRGVFDGLRPAPEKDAPVPAPKAPAQTMFDGLRLKAAEPEIARQKVERLGPAVAQYARAQQDSQRMTGQGLAELEYQKKARLLAAQMLDQIQPGTALDLDTAFAKDPGLLSEAANGRTAAAIRALQIEAELRTNPELRADRFVQAWQQLRAQRDKLQGWRNEGARASVDNRMTAVAKGIEKDPAMGRALVARASQLGLGKQWSLEWSRSSPDGGIGRELSDQARARAIGMALTDSLGRGRGLSL